MRIFVQIKDQGRRIYNLQHCAPQPKGLASLPMKVQLTTTVRGFSISPYPKGSILEARMAPRGALEVVGAQHLPLRPHEWSLVLTDDDLERLLPDE